MERKRPIGKTADSSQKSQPKTQETALITDMDSRELVRQIILQRGQIEERDGSPIRIRTKTFDLVETDSIDQLSLFGSFLQWIRTRMGIAEPVNHVPR